MESNHNSNNKKMVKLALRYVPNPLTPQQLFNVASIEFEKKNIKLAKIETRQWEEANAANKMNSKINYKALLEPVYEEKNKNSTKDIAFMKRLKSKHVAHIRKVQHDQQSQLTKKLIQQAQKNQEEDDLKLFYNIENFIQKFYLINQDFEKNADKIKQNYKDINQTLTNAKIKEQQSSQSDKKTYLMSNAFAYCLVDEQQNMGAMEMKYFELPYEDQNGRPWKITFDTDRNQVKQEKKRNDLLKQELFSNVEEEKQNINDKVQYEEGFDRFTDNINAKIINAKIQKEHLPLEEFSLGEFISQNIFKQYFSFNEMIKRMYSIDPNTGLQNNVYNNTQPLMSFFKPQEENQKQSKKKIEIYTQMFDDFEMKLDFSLKFCHKVYRENLGNSTIAYYFQLLMPPGICLYQYDSNSYENPFTRDNWIRVYNFFIKRKEFDELYRLNLVNNTVLRIVLKLDNSILLQMIEQRLKHFQLINNEEILEKHFKILNWDFAKIENQINEELPLCPVLTMNLLNKVSCEFDIKYNLLCLVSQNRISVYCKDNVQILNQIPLLDQQVVIETLENMYKRNRPMNNLNSIEQFLSQGPTYELFQTLYEQNLITKGIVKIRDRSNLSFIKRILATPNGLIFQPKELEMSNRVLRKYQEIEDRFIRINCGGDTKNSHNLKFVTTYFYKEILRCINLFGLQYKFLGFSSSQLRASNCWFYAEPNSQDKKDILTREELITSLGNFESNNILAKRAARIGQCFSTSTPFQLPTDTQILEEEDVKSESNEMFSDGIGKISSDIIQEIQRKLQITKLAVIQIRYLGCKGVLSENKDLPPKTIVVRKSMIKFQSPKINSIDILDYNKFRAGFLNRQIILLLSTLGVSDEKFISLQHENLEQLEKISYKDASIFKYFNSEYNGQLVQLNSISQTIRAMINANMEIEKEPFAQGILRVLRYRSYVQLKKKSNILVKNASRPIGVLDDYGILNEGEVYVSILTEPGQQIQVLSGDIMITRNPCLHPGDIRIVRAIDSKDVQEKLKHFVNCIVFPRKGEIPITSQISGSDLDGDCFFVSWDDRLLPPKTVQPFNYASAAKANTSSNISLDTIFDFFLSYINNQNLGRIDNSHLALADQSTLMALDPKCLKLAELHASAVDFAKTGYTPDCDQNLLAQEWPDFMEKKEKYVTYESNTVLGKLYREVCGIIENKKKELQIPSQSQTQSNNQQMKFVIGNNNILSGDNDEIIIDPDLVIDKFSDMSYYYIIKQACDELLKCSNEVLAILEKFGIQSEFELWSGNFIKLSSVEKHRQRNIELLQKRILDQIVSLKKRYEQIIYEECDGEYGFNETSNENKKKIVLRASAWKQHTLTHPNHPVISQFFKNMDFQQFQGRIQKRFIGCCWFICCQALCYLKYHGAQKLFAQQNFETNQIEDNDFID